VDLGGLRWQTAVLEGGPGGLNILVGLEGVGCKGGKDVRWGSGRDEVENRAQTKVSRMGRENKKWYP